MKEIFRSRVICLNLFITSAARYTQNTPLFESGHRAIYYMEIIHIKTATIPAEYH